jgi:hypothetical protein
MLKNDQLQAFNILKLGKNVFLTGEGGTGKSYVINKYIKYCEENDINIVVTAPTGIAALNVNGATLHRTFKIPIEPLVSKPKGIPKTLKDADVLVIEEISMVRLDVFDYVAQIIISLNAYRRNHGSEDIQVILCGDFFQLPPVLLDRDKEILEQVKYHCDIGHGFAFQSEYWDTFNFIPIVLRQQKRQSDSNFITALNYIRKGDYTSIQYLERMSQPKPIKDAIMLCGRNKVVNDKNEEEFNKLKTKIFTYQADIEGTVAESDKIVLEELKLRVGCRVMTVVNDLEDRYVNGSFGYVTRLDEDHVYVLIDGSDEEVEISRYKWEIKTYTAQQKKGSSKLEAKADVIGTFIQYPLKLAYAITIHKSQGQTYTEVNLDPTCWDCGQLYVALSRVKSIEGLHLLKGIQRRFIVTAPEVREFYSSLNIGQ